MNEKQKLIYDLETCRNFILESISLTEELKKQKKKIQSAEKDVNRYSSEKASSESAEFSLIVPLALTLLLTLISPIILFIAELVIEIVSGYRFMPLDGKLLDIKTYLIVAAIAFVISLILHVITVKKLRDDLPLYTNLLDNAVSSHTEEIQKYNSMLEKMGALSTSPANQLIKDLIPQDYLSIDAIDKFLFFLKNGHADTLKEALKLYDEYQHRQKLEMEAMKASASAQDAAMAAAITAAKTAEISQKTKEIAKNSENTEFWAIYNAAVSEEINNKLNK